MVQVPARVIPPLAITDARLTSSSVPESAYAAWSNVTAYTKGQKVSRVATNYHHDFEAADSSTGVDPMADTTGKWIDLGPTNRHKMFDLLRNTGTVGDNETETYVITPGTRVDSTGIVGLDASHLALSVTVDGDEVYAYEEDLSTRGTTAWYGYFFGAFSFKSAISLFDLPPYTDAVLTLTVTKAGGVPTVGGWLVGMNVDLGVAEIGAVDSADNYSKITYNEFGESQLTPRRSVPIVSATIWCKAGNLRNVRLLRDSLNAVPALWALLADASHDFFESVLRLGVYAEFDIPLEHPDDIPIKLVVKEV